MVTASGRTPVYKYLSLLAPLSASQLGAVAIKDVVGRSKLKADEVDEVIMGNVLSAGMGQAPARQAAIFAGLSEKTTTYTVNKVCASGLKAIALAAQSIALGQSKIVVAGGMESMSNVPFYDIKRREGQKMGHGEIKDGIILDGLWDVYNNFHMGNCAEDCAKKYQFSRADQDDFAFESYNRSKAAAAANKFKTEIIPVTLPGGRGKPGKVISDDELVTQYNPAEDKSVPRNLRPAFLKENGTVTAFNSSKINDGAAAMVLMDEEEANRRGLKPLARILSYADAEQAPIEFTTAPAVAIPLALKRAGLSVSDVGAFEINEAFAVVSLANNKILKLDPAIVNMYGGAVSIGHPIGASGTRIAVTLLSVLQQEKSKLKSQIGVAAICNGGGGATAVVFEAL